jgi:SAM-dependent methyltransferase
MADSSGCERASELRIASVETMAYVSKLRLSLRLLRQGWDPGSILFLFELMRMLKGCQSVLDIGCGPASIVHLLNFEHSVGIDGYEPTIAQAREAATHKELIRGDVREVGKYFSPKQFDCCIALDVIEHLQKDEGYQLLEDMEKIAARKILLLTPNGFLPQRNRQVGELQEHQSGWKPDEMRERGFHVIGMLGHKKLRGEYHAVRFWPKWFWSGVSLLTHFFWTRSQPDKAAAILCVKTLSRS